MSSARLRLLRAGLVLPLPLLALFALARPPARPPANAPAPLAPAPVAPDLAAHAAVLAFLENGRPTPPAGRGLFATDFFQAPPPPPVTPAPPRPAPPPPPRPTLAYRGYAAFPDGGTPVAYLSLDGRPRTLVAGELVAEGWRLLSFDADAAELARGDARLRVPFQGPVPLPPP